MNRQWLMWTWVLALVMCSVIALAQSDLPVGLQKIKEENERYSIEFLSKVSFLIAFLAGVTTILSPCILPVLPAFFAYTFREKTQLTKMTLLFFLGFTPIFILLGIAATSVGDLFTSLFMNIHLYIMIAGALLALLGLLTFFGLTFSLSPVQPSAIGKDWLGVLMSGMLFGFGWVLCVGPILSGVLIAASAFHNYVTTIWLMLAYSLGVFVPLFLFSFFYDRYDLGTSSFMQGKTFKVAGIELHSHHMIAGVLLMLTGALFIFYKGTGILNTWNVFGLKDYFYLLQDFFLEHTLIANVIGALILLGVCFAMYQALKK